MYTQTHLPKTVEKLHTIVQQLKCDLQTALLGLASTTPTVREIIITSTCSSGCQHLFRVAEMVSTVRAVMHAKVDNCSLWSDVRHARAMPNLVLVCLWMDKMFSEHTDAFHGTCSKGAMCITANETVANFVHAVVGFSNAVAQDKGIFDTCLAFLPENIWENWSDKSETATALTATYLKMLSKDQSDHLHLLSMPEHDYLCAPYHEPDESDMSTDTAQQWQPLPSNTGSSGNSTPRGRSPRRRQRSPELVEGRRSQPVHKQWPASYAHWSNAVFNTPSRDSSPIPPKSLVPASYVVTTEHACLSDLFSEPSTTEPVAHDARERCTCPPVTPAQQSDLCDFCTRRAEEDAQEQPAHPQPAAGYITELRKRSSTDESRSCGSDTEGMQPLKYQCTQGSPVIPEYSEDDSDVQLL